MTAKNNSSRGRQSGADKKQTKKEDSSSQKSKSSFGKSKDKNFRPHPQKIKNFKKKPSDTTQKSDSDEIRLNKYIANSGICSRREADTYIKTGSATVNGKIITEMGYKVKLTDEVRFDDALISPEAKRYVLLNKPKNYITTMDDENGRKTVMELINNAAKERIYPVGRLDRLTTGLLLFTNDGEMAKKLTHPKHQVKKLYHVHLDKKLSMSDLTKISENFVLDGKMVFVDNVSYIENKPKNEIGIEIHSGRNRIVRRIFEHFGYKVTKLDRVIFAGLTKKNLSRGVWRHLTQQEVNNLKMI
ncbi:MAG: rRNA pseudouridine synthase [Flavobacteriaceae bacterium]|nr:rRNA pseudouridine synthase [Flavobacteriaceae bacterium]